MRRLNLGIGLVFVAARIARESLTIIGWVAMWRPVQIFLYDWWPLKGRIKVYENLRFARVGVVQA